MPMYFCDFMMKIKLVQRYTAMQNFYAKIQKATRNGKIFWRIGQYFFEFHV